MYIMVLYIYVLFVFSLLANKNTDNNNRLTKSSKEEEEGDYGCKLSSAVENLFQLSQGDSINSGLIIAEGNDGKNIKQRTENYFALISIAMRLWLMKCH